MTGPALRAGLVEIYRRGWQRYITERLVDPPRPAAEEPRARARPRRVVASAR